MHPQPAGQPFHPQMMPAGFQPMAMPAMAPMTPQQFAMMQQQMQQQMMQMQMQMAAMAQQGGGQMPIMPMFGMPGMMPAGMMQQPMQKQPPIQSPIAAPVPVAAPHAFAPQSSPVAHSPAAAAVVAAHTPASMPPAAAQVALAPLPMMPSMPQPAGFAPMMMPASMMSPQAGFMPGFASAVAAPPAVVDPAWVVSKAAPAPAPVVVAPVVPKKLDAFASLSDPSLALRKERFVMAQPEKTVAARAPPPSAGLRAQDDQPTEEEEEFADFASADAQGKPSAAAGDDEWGFDAPVSAAAAAPTPFASAPAATPAAATKKGGGRAMPADFDDLLAGLGGGSSNEGVGLPQLGNAPVLAPAPVVAVALVAVADDDEDEGFGEFTSTAVAALAPAASPLASPAPTSSFAAPAIGSGFTGFGGFDSEPASSSSSFATTSSFALPSTAAMPLAAAFVPPAAWKPSAVVADEDEEEDFADFASSSPAAVAPPLPPRPSPTSAAAAAPAAGSSVAVEDDDESCAEDDNEDEFGGFESHRPPAQPSAVDVAADQEEEEDFADFSSAATAAPVAHVVQPPAAVLPPPPFVASDDPFGALIDAIDGPASADNVLATLSPPALASPVALAAVAKQDADESFSVEPPPADDAEEDEEDFADFSSAGAAAAVPVVDNAHSADDFVVPESTADPLAVVAPEPVEPAKPMREEDLIGDWGAGAGGGAKKVANPFASSAPVLTDSSSMDVPAPALSVGLTPSPLPNLDDVFGSLLSPSDSSATALPDIMLPGLPLSTAPPAVKRGSVSLAQAQAMASAATPLASAAPKPIASFALPEHNDGDEEEDDEDDFGGFASSSLPSSAPNAADEPQRGIHPSSSLESIAGSSLSEFSNSSSSSPPAVAFALSDEAHAMELPPALVVRNPISRELALVPRREWDGAAPSNLDESYAMLVQEERFAEASRCAAYRSSAATLADLSKQYKSALAAAEDEAEGDEDGEQLARAMKLQKEIKRLKASKAEDSWSHPAASLPPHSPAAAALLPSHEQIGSTLAAVDPEWSACFASLYPESFASVAASQGIEVASTQQAKAHALLTDILGPMHAAGSDAHVQRFDQCVRYIQDQLASGQKFVQEVSLMHRGGAARVTALHR